MAAERSRDVNVVYAPLECDAEGADVMTVGVATVRLPIRRRHIDEAEEAFQGHQKEKERREGLLACLSVGYDGQPATSGRCDVL